MVPTTSATIAMTDSLARGRRSGQEGVSWLELVGADLLIWGSAGPPVLGTILTAADGTVHGRGQGQEANNYTVRGKASSWSRAGKPL